MDLSNCVTSLAKTGIFFKKIKQAVIDNLRRHIESQKVCYDITLLLLKQQVETKL